MKRPARGYTLVEILIASAMAMVVLGVTIRIFWFGRQVEREARSSYLVREDVDVAFRHIQDELRMTHLSSIRVGSDNSSFSMASPVKDNKLTSFELTSFGVAKWKTWVHFCIQGNGDNVGDLVRWEAPIPENVNLAKPSPFDPLEPTGDKWTILSHVVQPGMGPVAGSEGQKLQQLDAVPDNAGIQLRFVRYEAGKEVLSVTNPAQNDDARVADWSQGTSQLVDCRLQVADISKESGKLSLYTLNFRVKPRN